MLSAASAAATAYLASGPALTCSGRATCGSASTTPAAPREAVRGGVYDSSRLVSPRTGASSGKVACVAGIAGMECQLLTGGQDQAARPPTSSTQPLHQVLAYQ